MSHHAGKFARQRQGLVIKDLEGDTARLSGRRGTGGTGETGGERGAADSVGIQPRNPVFTLSLPSLEDFLLRDFRQLY